MTATVSGPIDRRLTLAPTDEPWAVFARVRRLEILVSSLLRRVHRPVLHAVAGVPLRGPARAILEAEHRRRMRVARRVTFLMARHCRDALRALDHAGEHRARTGPAPPGDTDWEERRIRLEVIIAGLDRLTAWIANPDEQAEEGPAASPREPVRDIFLQNELTSEQRPHLSHGCEEQPLRAASPPLRSPDRRLPHSGSAPSTQAVPIGRGAGTLEDPLIRPVAPHRFMEGGLAPGRVPTVVIDARSPPLFGPAREDWFREHRFSRSERTR